MKILFNKKQLNTFFQINIGLIMAATTTALFLKPYNIVTGGSSGLGLLIYNLFKIDMELVIFIVNIVLVILGLIFMGKDFFLKTVYGSIMFPVYVVLITYLLSFMNIEKIDLFLVIIFGAILTGCGIGLVLKNNGTTGGTDIVQAIFFKYLNIPYSKTMYIFDGLIIVVGMFFVSFSGGLAAIIYMVLTGKVIDNIIFGGFNKRAVYIISEKNDEIKSFILNNLVRGTTKILAQGGYLNDKRDIILAVLESNEYFNLRAYIDKIDKYAFIYVTRATEVRGLGFSVESPLRSNKKKKRVIK